MKSNSSECFQFFFFYPFFLFEVTSAFFVALPHPFWSARSPFRFNVFQYAVSDICFRSALFFRRKLIFIPFSAHFSIYLPYPTPWFHSIFTQFR